MACFLDLFKAFRLASLPVCVLGLQRISFLKNDSCSQLSLHISFLCVITLVDHCCVKCVCNFAVTEIYGVYYRLHRNEPYGASSICHSSEKCT